MPSWGNGVRPPRLKENVLLTPRLLIAKFRSREGNRGVFFLISVSSFTDNPSSQTMLAKLAAIDLLFHQLAT